jgi:SAM-dependent methyltransferase
VTWQLFDHVAQAYDAARPDYPGELFDTLESALGQPLLRARVLDVGAGTGIATRALAGRGADVVAVDPGPVVLSVLRSRSTSRVHPLLGDGNALPLCDGHFDLVTYAQSFHWTRPERSLPEAARVLHDRGVLALWWNLLDTDEQWYDEWSDLAGLLSGGAYDRGQADVDYSVPARESGLFQWVRTVDVPWRRSVRVDDFVTDMSSHSYVSAMHAAEQGRLLEGLRAGLRRDQGPDPVEITYRTRLIVARR